MPFKDPEKKKEYDRERWKKRSLNKVSGKVSLRELIYLCEECENQFTPSKSRKQRFCSIQCANKFLGRTRRKIIDLPSALELGDVKLDKILGYTRTYFKDHPEANTWGYVYTHRLVAEKMVGRPLRKNEIVHHKNGKRWDNREENLEVMDKSDHAKLHGQRQEDLAI